MRRAISLRAAAAAAAGLLSGLIPSAVLAQEQSPGPAPLQRTILLTSPGVVFMNTDVTIKGRLKYADSSTITGFKTINQSYDIPWGTGSGFVVDPGGTTVTASHVVEVPKQDARNYFANRVVLETFDYTYDSPFDQYTVPDRFVNRLLQQCYEGSACRVEVEPIVTVYTAVDVAGAELPIGLPGKVLTSTGFEDTDVAVIKVAGQNMATVPLAASAAVQSGDEIAALGFAGSAQSLPSGVTEPTKLFGNVSNIRAEGTGEIIEVDIDIEEGMSGGPVINQQGEVIGLSSFYIRTGGGSAGQGYLRTVEDIRAAMADAGVTAIRGPVDDNFKQAMDLYWGNHFTDAVPAYQKVLALSDGHPLAKKYLAESQASAGGPNDVPLDAGGFPILIVAAVAGVVLLGLIAFLATRKRTPASAVAASGAVATETRAVGFQAERPAAAAPPQPMAGAPEMPAPTAAVHPPTTAPAATPPEPTGAPAPAVGGAAAPGSERKFCGTCGAELIPGNAFCGSCGAKVP